MADRLDEDFLEKLIIKSILIDKRYAVLVSRVFKKEYFVDAAASAIFEQTANHIEEHNSLPPRNIIENTVEDGIRSDITNFFSEIDLIDFSIEQQYDYLLNETNEYLKEQAVKRAILDSVDIIESRDNRELIREKVEEALTKDLKVDLGLNYFSQLGERLQRIFTATDIRVPTYFPQFDEFLSGGFPPLTLSVLVAKIHGFKCLEYNSEIIIKQNEKIKNIKIGDFYINTCIDEYMEEQQMPNLQSFINKHGEIEGKIKYDGWKNKISISKIGKKSTQKGISKLELFQKKYGIEEGKQRYNIFIIKQKQVQSVKGRKTKIWYEKKYGIEEGGKRYNQYINSLKKGCKGINTIQWYEKKYGIEEGGKRYKEKNKKISDKGRGTLLYFQKKYGIEEGKQRYNLYIEKQKFSHSYAGYFQKYGIEEGTKKWEERLFHLKHTTSLKGFILRHGEIEGQKRWKQRTKKWLNSYKKMNFSFISQKLFWEIYNRIKNDFKEIYFAQLNENKIIDITGKNHEYKIDYGFSYFKPDFFIKDKNIIIEFDGDYWHGKARGNQEKDKKRDNLLLKAGYSILHIKERDYKNNFENIIKKCLEFIYE